MFSIIKDASELNYRDELKELCGKIQVNGWMPTRAKAVDGCCTSWYYQLVQRSDANEGATSRRFEKSATHFTSIKNSESSRATLCHRRRLRSPRFPFADKIPITYCIELHALTGRVGKAQGCHTGASLHEEAVRVAVVAAVEFDYLLSSGVSSYETQHAHAGLPVGKGNGENEAKSCKFDVGE